LGKVEMANGQETHHWWSPIHEGLDYLPHGEDNYAAVDAFNIENPDQFEDGDLAPAEVAQAMDQIFAEYSTIPMVNEPMDVRATTPVLIDLTGDWDPIILEQSIAHDP